MFYSHTGRQTAQVQSWVSATTQQQRHCTACLRLKEDPLLLRDQRCPVFYAHLPANLLLEAVQYLKRIAPAETHVQAGKVEC